jgi:flagellin
MPQTINTNIASLNAQRNLNTVAVIPGHSMQRLSSGLRVNSAKDDAAGLAIAERMNAQVRGMNVRHAQRQRRHLDGADQPKGALGKVADALQRMRELAVQSANATNSASDKDSLDKEFGELAKEVQRVLGGTTFNGKHVLGGEAGASTFQVGANTTADDTIDITTIDLTPMPPSRRGRHRQRRHRTAR